MKVGSAVLGLHVAVLCVFALTQGCVTTESQGSGRGAGARHKGPWKHEHKGKSTETMVATHDPYYGMGEEQGEVYEPVVIDTAPSSQPYAAPQSSPNTETYIVQKGDILSQLAVDFDTSTATLVELNNLSNPDVLYVGQELRVPAGRKGSSSASSSAKKSRSIKKGGTYTIQKGDTLSEIALAAGVSINDLRELNNIKGDQIFAGEKIDIPAHGKVPTVKKKTSAPKSEPAPVVETAPVAAEPAPAPLAPVEPVVEPAETATMSVDMVEDKVLYPGETLDDVARQYGVSKAEIMRLNNITDETAVREGQRLRIPIAE